MPTIDGKIDGFGEGYSSGYNVTLIDAAEKAADAAEAMGITAAKLKDAGLIDQIIKEPLGSAYRDTDFVVEQLRNTFRSELDRLKARSECG